jgi:hypothetical protein
VGGDVGEGVGECGLDEGVLGELEVVRAVGWGEWVLPEVEVGWGWDRMCIMWVGRIKYK